MIRFSNTMAAANFIPDGEGTVRFVLPDPFRASILMGETEAEGAKTLWQFIFRCFLLAGHACALLGLVAPLHGCGLLLCLFVLWIPVIVSIRGRSEPAGDDEREQRDWVSYQRSRSISRRGAFWFRNAAGLAFVLCIAAPILFPIEESLGLEPQNLFGLFVVICAWMGFFAPILSSPKAKGYWVQSTGH